MKMAEDEQEEHNIEEHDSKNNYNKEQDEESGWEEIEKIIQFKEIEETGQAENVEETEQDEEEIEGGESLEEELSGPVRPASKFSEVSFSPSLQAAHQPSETIEQELENVPSAQKKEEEDDIYQAKVYNMPESSYEPIQLPAIMREEGILLEPKERTQQVNRIPQNWQQERIQSEEETIKDYKIKGAEMEDRGPRFRRGREKGF